MSNLIGTFRIKNSQPEMCILKYRPRKTREEEEEEEKKKKKKKESSESASSSGSLEYQECMWMCVTFNLGSTQSHRANADRKVKKRKWNNHTIVVDECLLAVISISL